MNKLELQSILMDYFKSNDLFGKDKNFLVNKAASFLGVKKTNIQKAVAFLIAENQIAIKNDKIFKKCFLTTHTGLCVFSKPYHHYKRLKICLYFIFKQKTKRLIIFCFYEKKSHILKN